MKASSVALLAIFASLAASVLASTKYGYASSWNTYEEVEVTGWVDDMFGSAVAAFLIAPVLLVLGVIIIVWNERRAIRMTLSLKELLESVFAARGSSLDFFRFALRSSTAF
jgi:hypothetical protein